MVLYRFFAVGFVVLLLVAVARSGVASVALRMLSRIFVSGRRREPPVVQRGGGIARLEAPLASLVRSRRRLEAAVDDLRTLAPDYHRSFESGTSSVLDDRRRQALRRDFEDAVIHVTRSLDAVCEATDALDAPSRARLAAIGPVPDASAVLERFPWLPREVHQIGHLHFRSDEAAFERHLFELDTELRQLEDALTHEAGGTYR